jgi:hypothetical protein
MTSVGDERFLLETDTQLGIPLSSFTSTINTRYSAIVIRPTGSTPLRNDECRVMIVEC